MTFTAARQLAACPFVAVPFLLPCFFASKCLTHVNSTGRMQQHVEVKYTFNSSAKVVVYEQNILWKESE